MGSQTPDDAARVRRPISARQRAVYRRRRIAVSGIALVLIGVLTLGVQGAHALISGLIAPEPAALSLSQADTAITDSDAALPVRLDVPAAGISVPLAGAGLDTKGRIDAHPGSATWYTGHERVTPGELGTAVVAGRVTDGDGQPGAFAEVATIQEGDRVVVTFADGVTLELDVVSTHLVDKDDLQFSDVVWGNQAETRRVALVTADQVLDADGKGRGTFLAVADLG